MQIIMNHVATVDHIDYTLSRNTGLVTFIDIDITPSYYCCYISTVAPMRMSMVIAVRIIRLISAVFGNKL